MARVGYVFFTSSISLQDLRWGVTESPSKPGRLAQRRSAPKIIYEGDALENKNKQKRAKKKPYVAMR
jgi:hypothetical protein